MWSGNETSGCGGLGFYARLIGYTMTRATMATAVVLVLANLPT